MKILLINKFHYLRGGAERVYFETKKLLEEKGHQVVCFSMKDERNEDSPFEKYFVDNVDFNSRQNWFKKSLHFLYYRQASKKLALLLEKEKPEIAHLHNISHQLTYSILKPLRKKNIPIVQTLHDYQLLSPNYNLYSHGQVDECCRKGRYYKCFWHKCVRNSYWQSLLASLELYLIRFFKWDKYIDQYLAPSRFLVKKFQEWDIERKIKVINNFIDLEKYEPTFEPGDYLVYVGRLSREKGIMTLVNAIRKLPEIKLKIVGTGPQKALLEKFVKEKQIKNVQVLGPRYNSDLQNVIKKARFLVVPSEWYENYPMIVLEAMALGKPVLGTKIGGLQEMIVEGENGWFAKPNDIKDLRAKIKVAQESPDLEKMGQQARATVEQNNGSEKYYQELFEVYQGLVGRDGVELG